MILLSFTIGEGANLRPAYSSIGRLTKVFTEKTYQDTLAKGDVHELKEACINFAKISASQRLRELSIRLKTNALSTKDFDTNIAFAEALMACKAPLAAMKILDRLPPPPSLKARRHWLVLSWQAASAGLDHSKASLALRKLVQGDLKKLEQEYLVIGVGKDGFTYKRSALDVLAEHERSLGNWNEASMVMLSGRSQGALGARRLMLAAQTLGPATKNQQKKLLDKAEKMAVSDKAWWLVKDILKLRLTLGNSSKLETMNIRDRLEGLAKNLDDNYTVLEIIRLDDNRKNEGSLFKNHLSPNKW